MKRFNEEDQGVAIGIRNAMLIMALVACIVAALSPMACSGQALHRPTTGWEQTIWTIPQPTGHFFGGVVLSNNVSQSAFYVPENVQLQLERAEMDVTVGEHASFMRRNTITYCDVAAGSNCYGDIHLTLGEGVGLVNADYRRVEHNGPGPSIARKTAVRGAAAQWAVWAEQINLGPGAKAALWIGGDNPETQGRVRDSVPNVIVINDNLDVTGASIQRNAPVGGTGAVLRVFQGGQITAELLENGTLRVKKIEMLP